MVDCPLRLEKLSDEQFEPGANPAPGSLRTAIVSFGQAAAGE